MSGGHPYKMRHKFVTSTLTVEEHERATEIAARQGMKATPWATRELRRLIELETQKEKIA